MTDTLQKIDPADEKRVVSAMEQAVKLANDGATPNDAIIKVATEEKLGSEFVRRMVEAFNISKTLSHFKNASADGGRAEAFPLADANEILGQMYPTVPDTPATKAAAAEHPYYMDPFSGVDPDADFMKVAGELPPLVLTDKPCDPYPRRQEVIDGEALSKLAALDRTQANAERAHITSTFASLGDLDKTAAYWRQLSPPVSFAEADMRVQARHGRMGKAAMDLIYESAGLKKMGTARFEGTITQQLIYPLDGPYPLIDALIEKAAAVVDTADQLVNATDAVEKIGAPLEPEESDMDALVQDAGGGAPRPFDQSLSTEKQAVDPLFMTAMMANRALKSAPQRTEADLEREALEEVFDPQHESELAQIRAQTMLTDLMTNDPVISKFVAQEGGQDAVLQAYNEISEFAPESAAKPLVLRQMLREALSSGIREGGEITPQLDTQRVEQLGSIEKRIGEGADRTTGPDIDRMMAASDASKEAPDSPQNLKDLMRSGISEMVDAQAAERESQEQRSQLGLGDLIPGDSRPYVPAPPPAAPEPPAPPGA
jgi:hypothetical protein